MSLPDESKLRSLAKKTTAEKEQLGLPTYGYFWSSEFTAKNAYYMRFDAGYTGATDKYSGGNKVLCVGD